MIRIAADATVEFRSDDDPHVVLQLAYHARDDDFGTLALVVQGDGLSIDETLRSECGDGLDSFLASLAPDSRGWDGARTWNATYGGMSIEATHHRNRVELLFILLTGPLYLVHFLCGSVPAKRPAGCSLGRWTTAD
jgi:hypothetical protein